MMAVSPWTDGKYQKCTKGIWAQLPQCQKLAGTSSFMWEVILKQILKK